MRNSLKNLLSLVLTLGFTASSALFAATPITVVNAGFEDPVLGDDSSSTTITGWSVFASASFAGAWNPPASDYPLGAPEGLNVGSVYDSQAFSGFSQVLQGAEGQFQADTTYELKVKVGNPTSADYDGYIIQLVVNNNVIAQDDNSRVPTVGSFVATSVKYIYNAGLHAALVGYPIEIRLLTKGLMAGSTWVDVNFDDVTLTYASSNPVAIHGGPYSLNTSFPLALNASASLPSPEGTAITNYEWDLNNDGTFGDIPNIAIPAPISYATLTGSHGMVPGENTISLLITDDTGKSVTSSTTVSLNTLHTYIGPGAWRQNDRWNQNVNYWSPAAVPSGAVDVLIPDNASTLVWNALTPTYTGNLYMGVNSSISIGWTDQILPSYNALGTPGKTTIFMEQGAYIGTRMAGYPIIPAIQLTGDASFSLGSSTQNGADASFNHGITGPYKFYILGNRQSGRVANLNTRNTFSELLGAPIAYQGGGCTIKARAPGSLGTGNVTIGVNDRGEPYAYLEIWAEDAMADTGTLSIDGDSAIKLWMYANDTIAAFIVNGKNLPSGTYGSTTSNASNKVSWIGGDKVLTVTDSPDNYWDTNDLAAGAGGATPTGTWDGTTKWTSSPTGTTATSSWISGSSATFAAGTDATGAYTVTVGAPAGISVTNLLPAVVIENPKSDLLITKYWERKGGNTVAVLISAINATGFTATYAGQPMTVKGVYETGLNSYSGIAYIISDSLPATGNVVINMPYDSAVTGGGYARFGYAYSILSLSGVDSAGTPVSKTHSRPPRTTELTYATTTNNAYILSVASDSDWHNSPVTIAGQANEIIFSGSHPGAYYNTLLCHGSIAAAGTYTDAFSGSPNNMITLPFEASTESNPSFTNQKITGLSFDHGTVTLTAGELELQGENSITANAAGAGIINTHLSGVAGAGITKRGAGIVTLGSTANNYPGDTNIVNGTLQSGASEVLPGSSPIYIGGDASSITAILDLNNFNQTIDSLTLSGATTTSEALVSTGTGTLTLGGDITYTSPKNPLGATISGKLSLGSSDRTFSIQDSSSAANDLTISAILSGDSGVGFTKNDFGTLLLSEDNIYTGLTTVSGGLLTLSGSNSAATGGITVNNGGAICFESLASINGTGQNVTIESGGLAYFGSSFGAGNIPTALTTRFHSSSTGAVAVDNFPGADFNFGSLNVSLGALDDVTYTGTLFPNPSGDYLIGGGSGTITLTGENALAGGNSLIVAGRVILANANNLSGATTILSGGRLQIGAGGTTVAEGSLPNSAIENNGTLAFNRADTIQPGTDFNSPVSGSGSVEQSGAGNLLLNTANSYSGGTNLVSGTLILGHATAIGTGPLTIYSGELDVEAGALTLTANNPIALSSNFTYGGTGNLNMGTGDISNYGSPTITLNGSNSTLTFGGVMTNGSGGNQTMTVDGPGNTLVLGGYRMSNDEDDTNINLTIQGTANVTITGSVDDLSGAEFFENYGTLTKTGTGTLTLYGDNYYTGNTVVEGGVLQLESGSQESPIIVNNGGKLGFTLGNTSDANTIISSQKLTLNANHKIRIVGVPTLNSYTLMTASSFGGVVPELETPIDDYELQIDGYSLILTNISDVTPPILTDIVDDKNGGTIPPNTLVTYTVTFNEEIDPATVTSADFDNNPESGYSTITIGAIAQTAPNVFTVEVTPTTVGTLQLRIPPSADIRDIADNALLCDPALLDDTIIQVKEPYDIWASGGAFGTDANGDGIANGLAWLLSASDVNDDARSLLPVAEEISGALKLTFITLDRATRGGASVKVQYSTDLGVDDTWISHEAEVPDTTSKVGEIEFDIDATTIGDGYIIVEATIPATEASPGTKLFARVSGSEAPSP